MLALSRVDLFEVIEAMLQKFRGKVLQRLSNRFRTAKHTYLCAWTRELCSMSLLLLRYGTHNGPENSDSCWPPTPAKCLVVRLAISLQFARLKMA